ncbi:MAG: hypothetical protein GKR87_11005 [Kiritimatiellae bacterium]|nr:hypothetical protein [Kiritimatiellia bacterium]
MPVKILLSVLILGGGCHLSESPTRSLTNQNLRVVWVQDQKEGSDSFARSQHLLLMGYDSQTGRERAILPEQGNYFKPLFTPDGMHIVFSDMLSNRVYVADWSGTSKCSLGSGVAVEVWEDPASHQVWVYVLDGPHIGGERHTPNPLYRFPLDEPMKREPVWDQTHMSWSNFQLSADGTKAGGLFPWPRAGILNLEKKPGGNSLKDAGLLLAQIMNIDCGFLMGPIGILSSTAKAPMMVIE